MSKPPATRPHPVKVVGPPARGTQTGPTLLEILGRRNPVITNRWKGVSYQNTTSGTDSFDHVLLDDEFPNTVQQWKDFTFNAIQLAYGDLLEKEITEFAGKLPELTSYQQVNDPPVTPTTIQDEGDIDTLGIVWTCPIVRGPLKAAAHVFRSRSGMVVKSSDAARTSATAAPKKIEWKAPTKKNTTQASGSQHQMSAGRNPNKETKTLLKPDWVIMDHQIMKIYSEERKATAANAPTEKLEAKSLAYAVGDSKLKQKWRSAWLGLAPEHCYVPMDPLATDRADKVRNRTVDEERLKPLHQVATYCRYAETRYAFILTQIEVVVLRIRRVSRMINTSQQSAAVEYAAVPWSATAKDGLTANLAIWALGCMAMNDHHRAMEGPGNTPLPSTARLTWWHYDAAHDRYENVISKRHIAAKDWHQSYGKFVKLDNDSDRQSSTDSFVRPASVPAIPKPQPPAAASAGLANNTANVKDPTHKLGALNLGTASHGGQSAPAGGPRPSATAAGPSNPSSSTKPAAPFKTCVIGKNTYSLHAKANKYFVYLDAQKKQAAWIKKDDKNRYTAEIGGKTQLVKMNHRVLS